MHMQYLAIVARTFGTHSSGSDETGVAGEAGTWCGLVRDGEETYEDGHSKARTDIPTTGKPRPPVSG